MDRFWFLTWTTYATWLPGDARGFVSDLRDAEGHKYRANEPRTELTADLPALRRFAAASLSGEPVRLTSDQAVALLDQFRETASVRGWLLLAAAVMANHAHLVVAVTGDPDPANVLRDFKGYGSRALNRRFGAQPSGTWWTEGGSKRKLPDEAARFGAIAYTRDQPGALVVWLNEGAIRSAFDEPLAVRLLTEEPGGNPPDVLDNRQQPGERLA